MGFVCAPPHVSAKKKGSPPTMPPLELKRAGMTELLENRRRRASFTKVLQRFYARLDAVSVFTVTAD